LGIRAGCELHPIGFCNFLKFGEDAHLKSGFRIDPSYPFEGCPVPPIGSYKTYNTPGCGAVKPAGKTFKSSEVLVYRKQGSKDNRIVPPEDPFVPDPVCQATKPVDQKVFIRKGGFPIRAVRGKSTEGYPGKSV